MDAEAKRIKDQIKNLPFKEKIANYWHYYKIHFFVIVLCIVVLGTAIVQCAMRVDPDMMVAMYSGRMYSDEGIAKLAELLETECVDIDGDGEIYVAINSSVADISNEKTDEMAMAVLQKFQVEVAANSSAAYILDEAYKNLMVDGYQYPKEDVIEISTIPEIRECLDIAEGQKLYWLPGFAEREKKEISQFTNGKKVEEYFHAKFK